jgi:hypothetical protein
MRDSPAQIWLELVALAADLIAWTQHQAFTGTAARCWEPIRLRLRLLASPAGSCAPAAANGFDYHAAGTATIICSPDLLGSTRSHPDPRLNPTTRTGHPRQTRRSTAPTSQTPTETRCPARVTWPLALLVAVSVPVV